MHNYVIGILSVICRHPDKNPDDQAEAKAVFQRIHAAYTRLTADDSSDEEDEGMNGASFFDEEDLAAAFFEFM